MDFEMRQTGAQMPALPITNGGILSKLFKFLILTFLDEKYSDTV